MEGADHLTHVAAQQRVRWHIEEDRLALLVGDAIQRLTADEIYTWAFEGQKTLHGEALDIADLASSTPVFVQYPALIEAAINFNSESDDSGLTLSLTASSNGQSKAIENVRSRFEDHVLIGDSWLPFAPGAMSEVLELLDKAGVTGTGPLTLRQYLELRRLGANVSWLKDNTEGQTVHPGINATTSVDALDLFTGSLYPYQRDGWQWLSFIWREQLGAILADEMGLGKTIQVIALLAAPERSMVAPSLIIAPGTLMENWRREISKFAPSLSTYIHQGANRTGDFRQLLGHDVVITSYDTVVRDGSMFRMVEWQVAVLDEAQAIKNPETKRAISVKKLRRKVGLAVTGTPIENRLRDLWSIVDFVLPGYLGDAESFALQFPDETVGASALEPVVSPIMLRRRVRDVAKDLPPRIDIPQILSLSDSETLEYESTRLAIMAQYGSSATLVALTKLRQFCAHPMLLDDQPWSVERAGTFTKFQRLFELVDEVFANGEKMIVFTSYNRMASMIEQTVRGRYGAFADTINGETPIGDRQGVVDALTRVPGPGLLALNPRAAGAGLNITAATHVVHYNLEWNPAIEDQASARAHRRGQDRPVTVHRLYFANTVEEAINNRLDRKRELSDTAVVGVEGDGDDYSDIMRALQISPVGKDKVPK
jgi:SNF2 family DNA or RNA helicase